jgi:Ca-activated chloride channel family protein
LKRRRTTAFQREVFSAQAGVSVSRIASALLVAALCALSSIDATSAAAQPVATFSSSIDLVPISAVVRDQRGRLVTALTASDFDVLDNGEQRRILDFRSDHTSPITLAVLLDTSGSMRMGSKLDFARDALRQLVSGLRRGSDEIALFTFDSAVHERQPFTTFPVAIESALPDSQPFGKTSLYDAIADTARRLTERPAARRAIVVLTDGLDTGSLLTPGDVSGIASSLDVPVYVIVTGPRIDQARFDETLMRGGPQAVGDLRNLAQWTGGDLLWVSGRAQGATQTTQILTELRQQYLIAIESSTANEWRPLEVRVRNQRFIVRARSGYFSR